MSAPTNSKPTKPLLSIVVPCYREADNLPTLVTRIEHALEAQSFEWELLLIDDHSPDATFEVAQRLALSNGKICVFRLARNRGSHVASLVGLELAAGDAAVIMAADLQDPPEVVPDLVAQWQTGLQVVWACRSERASVGPLGRIATALYNKLISSMVPDYKLPPQGADFLLVDRVVINALIRCRESRPNVLALVLWLGFRQGMISYKKDARLSGRSAWTLRRKVRLLLDSITGFSHLPLRLISIAGFVVALLGFLYAVVIIASYIIQPASVEGWASLMVAVLVLSGVQMMMLGVVGEYLWRALEQSRRRPRHNIEQSFDKAHTKPSVSREELLRRALNTGHPDLAWLSDAQLADFLWRAGRLRPHEVTGFDTADMDGQ